MVDIKQLSKFILLVVLIVSSSPVVSTQLKMNDTEGLYVFLFNDSESTVIYHGNFCMSALGNLSFEVLYNGKILNTSAMINDRCINETHTIQPSGIVGKKIDKSLLKLIYGLPNDSISIQAKICIPNNIEKKDCYVSEKLVVDID